MTKQRGVLLMALTCLLITAPAAALAQEGEPGTSYYSPQYHNGHIVYFDTAGRPFVYVNGGIAYIPASHTSYHSYLMHWRMHRQSYTRWYRGYGATYRHWRRPSYTSDYRPMYHDGYVIYYSPAGLPYYHLGGRTVYVPRTHAAYNQYASYYRAHRTRYLQWNRASGARLRTYRQPAAIRTRGHANHTRSVTVHTRAPAMAHPSHSGRATTRTPAMAHPVRRKAVRGPAMTPPARHGASSHGRKH